MGVNIFLLDRRSVPLLVGGTRQSVGTLRRFFKLTELNEERAAEIEAATRNGASPAAALLIDVHEIPLASAPSHPMAAHLVLGWDEGRGSVTDFGWDHLPRLGYALRDPATQAYILYEERDGVLHEIDAMRARQLGVLDTAGNLIRHGQPRIAKCRSVRTYFKGYAEADCTLETGADDKLLTETELGELPPLEWFVGKRPMDVRRYLRTEIPNV
jgi:hypothetical protein